MNNLSFTLLAALILSSFSAISQDCNYKLNEKDEFTGVTSLMTVSELVKKSGKMVYIEILRTDGKYFITMNYSEGGFADMNKWTANANDPLIFMFSDGSTMNLEPKESFYKTEPQRMDKWARAFLGSASAFGNKAIFAPQYQIDKKGLSQLATKTVSKFRITAHGKSGNTLEKIENIDFEIAENEASRIRIDAGCITKGDDSKTELLIPENLPLDEQTKKISFTDKIDIGTTGKDKLYDRAKSWLLTYTKNSQFISDSKENGLISKTGSFTKQFKKDGGHGYESDEFTYTLTIQMKEGKYKYSITDITISDGKQKMDIEPVFELYKKRPMLMKTVKEYVFEGVSDVIDNMKKAMSTDAPKTNGDW